tara:strand:- start:624 stop:1694 length:1071 start_codon:yes stop_codon:yes gene_type:complete
MGFLRKVGRKVSKKLNKVFGQKIGSIIGMVGLYFAMSWAAKGLSGWAKSTFGTVGETAKAAEAAKAAEITKTTADVAASGKELAALKDFSTVTKGTQSATGLNMANVEAAVTTGSQTVQNLTANAVTNVDSFNAWVGGHESLVTSGKMAPTISNSLTDTVIQGVQNPDVFRQTSLEVKQALEVTSQSANLIDPKNIMTEINPEFNFMPEVATEANFAKAGNVAVEEATTFQKIAADPVGYAAEGIKDSTKEGVEYIKSGDFIPDAFVAGSTAYVANEFAPEPESQYRGMGVQGQAMQEMAQENHTRMMQPQLAASGLQGVRTFSDLANQTLYGTGTPDYLQSLYQPLPTPTPLRIG